MLLGVYHGIQCSKTNCNWTPPIHTETVYKDHCYTQEWLASEDHSQNKDEKSNGEISKDFTNSNAPVYVYVFDSSHSS